MEFGKNRQILDYVPSSLDELLDKSGSYISTCKVFNGGETGIGLLTPTLGVKCFKFGHNEC
jgi:hypothetical protein